MILLYKILLFGDFFGSARSSLLLGLVSSFGKWGCSVAVHGLLIGVASLVAEHRL